jgi:hypothetical protein
MSAHLHFAVVRELDTMAIYMQSKFEALMSNIDQPCRRQDPAIPIPEYWSLQYAIEVDHAISVIAQAFANQGTPGTAVHRHAYMKSSDWTTWDVERYAEHISRKNSGRPDEHDEILQSKFQPLKPKTTLQIQPLTVADRHSKMLLWYLPGIFTVTRQVCWNFVITAGP